MHLVLANLAEILAQLSIYLSERESLILFRSVPLYVPSGQEFSSSIRGFTALQCNVPYAPHAYLTLLSSPCIVRPSVLLSHKNRESTNPIIIIIIILPIEKHMQSKTMVLYPPCY